MAAPKPLLILLLAGLPGLALAATGSTASRSGQPAQPAAAAPAAPAAPSPGNPNYWPSFLVGNDVLCLDEFDYNAFNKTGHFHSRGSRESCTRMTELTRVVVLNQSANPSAPNQSGQRSQVLVISGPLEWTVGWTNGRLPIAK